MLNEVVTHGRFDSPSARRIEPTTCITKLLAGDTHRLIREMLEVVTASPVTQGYGLFVA